MEKWLVLRRFCKRGEVNSTRFEVLQLEAALLGNGLTLPLEFKQTITK
jgi:hypothetical protein